MLLDAIFLKLFKYVITITFKKGMKKVNVGHKNSVDANQAIVNKCVVSQCCCLLTSQVQKTEIDTTKRIKFSQNTTISRETMKVMKTQDTKSSAEGTVLPSL